MKVLIAAGGLVALVAVIYLVVRLQRVRDASRAVDALATRFTAWSDVVGASGQAPEVVDVQVLQPADYVAVVPPYGYLEIGFDSGRPDPLIAGIVERCAAQATHKGYRMVIIRDGRIIAETDLKVNRGLLPDAYVWKVDAGRVRFRGRVDGWHLRLGT